MSETSEGTSSKIAIINARELEPQKIENLYSVFERCFPDPNERISKRQFLKQSADGDHLVLLLSEEPAGGVLFRLLPRPAKKTGFVEFLYIDRKIRGEKYGEELLRRAFDSLSERGAEKAIAEINDPNVMTAEELALDERSGISAHARLNSARKLGWQALDAPYVQPGLDGKPPVRYLQIACSFLSHPRQHLTGQEYREILESFFAPIPNSMGVHQEIFRDIGDDERLDLIALGSIRSKGGLN